MLNTTQIQQFLEISLAGSRTGQVLPARAICAAILAVKPGFIPAYIAWAFSHIVVDEFDEARTILYEVLQDFPDDEDALTMLGLTETLSNNTAEAQKCLLAVSASGTAEENPRVAMAKTLIKYIEGK